MKHMTYQSIENYGIIGNMRTWQRSSPRCSKGTRWCTEGYRPACFAKNPMRHTNRLF